MGVLHVQGQHEPHNKTLFQLNTERMKQAAPTPKGDGTGSASDVLPFSVVWKAESVEVEWALTSS